MNADIDCSPFPNIGNNPFYNKEFSIGNMLPQVPITDKDVIRRSIRPYADGLNLSDYSLNDIMKNSSSKNDENRYSVTFMSEFDEVVGEAIIYANDINASLIIYEDSLYKESYDRDDVRNTIFGHMESKYHIYPENVEVQFMEASDFKRSELPDDVFGIPEERKYPMPDKKHTISAMKLFNHCEKKYEEELAKHIIKNIEKYNIDPSFVGPKNRLLKYLIDEGLVAEGVCTMDDVSYILENMAYEFFGEKPKKSDSEELFERFFGEASKDNVKSVPDKIEPMVKKLENKNYRVKYASPGYVDTRFDNDKNKDGVINNKLVTTGRIIFERDYSFPNTPEGWEWKALSNGFKALYVRPFTYSDDNGSKKEAFDKWQNRYLNSLEKWIDDLPMMGVDNPKKDTKADENFSSGF